MTRQQQNQAIADRLFWAGELIQKLNRMGVAVASIDPLAAVPVVRIQSADSIRRLRLENTGHSAGTEGVAEHFEGDFYGARIICSVRGPSLLVRQCGGGA